MKVLVTGAAGFIAGYLIQELLDQDFEVVGLDDYSKYGFVERPYDGHPGYKFVYGDASDVHLLGDLALECDHFVAAAAKIGGIGYFHAYPYDLLAGNERLTAAAGDAAKNAYEHGRLRKVTWLSSSMVYESATAEQLPSKEGDEREIAPPRSSYGFSKLAVEYFARALEEQYGCPYTILRPFNCVGTGEYHTQDDSQGDHVTGRGNVELGMTHVVPDLVKKVLAGQDPLHILGTGYQVRHYTYGGDLAKGIVASLTSEAALNEDFNLSTDVPTTVRELAWLIWLKIKGPQAKLNLIHDEPFEHDVAKRMPDTEKAKKLLGFEAKTTLSQMLDEIVPWVSRRMADGSLG